MMAEMLPKSVDIEIVPDTKKLQGVAEALEMLFWKIQIALGDFRTMLKNLEGHEVE